MRRHALIPLSVLGLVLVVVLAGCGGGTAPQTETPRSHSPAPAASTPPPSPRPTATSASPSTGTPPPSPPSSTAPTRAASVTPTTLPSAVTDLSGRKLAEVVSPSRKIACLFTSDPRPSVRCDVNGASWGVARPADCPGVYGDSVSLTRKARLVCHGDTVFDPGISDTLGHGQQVTFHDLGCESGRTGITCRNQAGHGFTVSPENYKLF